MGPAVVVLLLIALIALGFDMIFKLVRRFKNPPLPEYVTVKEYPPGCLCIRGAMIDNPRCPHHPET